MVAKCQDKEPAFGYNAATGEYEDLIKAGVLDPAKVLCRTLMLEQVVSVVFGGGANAKPSAS